MVVSKDDIELLTRNCPQCSKRYQITDYTSGFVPLLLKCSHSLCEYCVKRSLSNNHGSVECKECNEITKPNSSIDRSHRNFRQEFPVADGLIKMLNELGAYSSYHVDENSIGFSDVVPKSLGACEECDVQLRVAHCVECNHSYCSACFNKIHKNKTLQNHRKILLSDVNDLVEQDGIAPISGLVMKVPDESVTGLNLQDLSRMYEEKRKKIQQSLLMANKLHKAMQEDLKTVYKKRSDILGQISSLINSLTLISKTVDGKLNEIEVFTKRNFSNCEESLRELDKNLKDTFNELKIASSSNDSKFTLIVPKFKRLLDNPDSISIVKSCHCELSLSLPKDVVSNLKENLEKCDFGNPGEYELARRYDGAFENVENAFTRRLSESCSSIGAQSVTTSVSSKDGFRRPHHSVKKTKSGAVFHQNPLGMPAPLSIVPVSVMKNVFTSQEMNCGNNFLLRSASECSASTARASTDRMRDNMTARTSRVLKTKVPKEGDEFHKVRISHINSPSDFWVHLPSQKYNWARIQEQLNAAGTWDVVPVEDLNYETLFVMRKEDTWCRVKILEMLSNLDVCSARVFLVDYGRDDVVTCSSLRKIKSNDLKTHAALAYNCRLYDCYPSAAPDWTETVTASFKTIVETSLLMMKIMRISKKLEVDLYLDNMMSIRDLLLQSERAQQLPMNDNITLTASTGYFEFSKDSDFIANSKVYVRAWHVENPGEFYVQRKMDRTDENFYKKLGDELTDYFKNNNNYRQHHLRNAVEGMAVAAQFSEDQRWYRAEIVEVYNFGKRYKVKYVDFGNKETLGMCKIRKIPEQFTNAVARAVRCTLNDVVPKEKKWDTKSIEYFSRLIDNVDLEMYIHKIDADLLHVSLYKNNVNNSGEFECVNHCLVSQGVARGTGLYSTVTTVITDTKKLPERLMNDIDESLKTKKVDPEATTKREAISSSEMIMSDINTMNWSDDRVRRKDPVTIIACYDPDTIYVQFDDSRKEIEELSNSMMKYYRDEKINKDTQLTTIDVDDTCAIFKDKDRKGWYRAKVVSKLENDQILVFLQDFGTKEQVLLNNCHSLAADFKKIKDGCIRCMLSNFQDDCKIVKNDSSYTPEVCNKLKDLVRKYKNFYITVLGRIEKSLSVVLWAKEWTCGGAMEPSKITWIDIGDTLKNGEKRPVIVADTLILENNVRQLEYDTTKRTLDETVCKWLRDSDEHSQKILEENNSESPYDDDIATSDSALMVDDIADWQPALKLEQRTIKCIPKFITNEMTICVQLLSDQESICRLEETFQDFCGRRIGAENHVWKEGQICMAFFRIFERWYRAKIMDIDEEKQELFVEFVDYGNVDWVSKLDVCPKVAFTDFPVQCYKLSVLADYQRLSKDEIAIVQERIADKECLVELMKEQRDDNYVIKTMFIEPGLTPINLYDMLADPKSYMLFPDEVDRNETGSILSESVSSVASIEEMLPEECVNQDMINDKRFLTYTVSSKKQVTDDQTLPMTVLEPPEGATLSVQVTEVLAEDLIVICVYDCENNPKISLMRDEFVSMESDLQTNAVKQPLIKEPFVGRLCCTRFDDGIWYRAIVMEGPYSDKYYIYYVDYGNAESANVSQLHQLKPEWYRVPAQAIKCKVSLNTDLKSMSDLINKKYKAIIRENRVPFHSKRDSNHIKYSLQLLELVR